MQLFNIAGKDFTTFITVPSYLVNQDGEYIEWTDGNYKKHRYLTRSKVSGSFTMLFNNVNDYYNFLNTINEKKTAGGYIPGCIVYCNNIMRTENVDLFIDFSSADIIPVIGTNDNEGFEVTIEEK